MLEKLCNRARHTYATYCSNSGSSQTILPLTLPDDIHDLSAFGGTKGGVVKSPASSPPKGDTPSSDSPPASGDCSANSAQQPQPPPGPGPSPIQQSQSQSQYGMPYVACAQDVTQGAPPDFRPSLYVVPQEQSILPSFQNGYSVSSERTQYPPPSQESAHQQNPLVLPPTEENPELNYEALGFPQQPTQYSLYPQLEQFRDIFMGENPNVQPAQLPQNDVWWEFVDDLGIQRI
jgi:hypothetical protein